MNRPLGYYYWMNYRAWVFYVLLAVSVPIVSVLLPVDEALWSFALINGVFVVGAAGSGLNAFVCVRRRYAIVRFEPTVWIGLNALSVLASLGMFVVSLLLWGHTSIYRLPLVLLLLQAPVFGWTIAEVQKSRG